MKLKSLVWGLSVLQTVIAPIVVEAAPPGSVQVNVDSEGDNILFDRAYEPTIAIDPANPNYVVIGWIQQNNASSPQKAGYASSSNGGRSWTLPGSVTLTEPEVSIDRVDPVLAAKANGDFFYMSFKKSGEYYCDVFKSTNHGQSWSATAMIGSNGYGGDKPWMTVGPANER